MAVGAVLAHERLNLLLQNDFGLRTKLLFCRGFRLGWLLLCEALGNRDKCNQSDCHSNHRHARVTADIRPT